MNVGLNVWLFDPKKDTSLDMIYFRRCECVHRGEIWMQFFHVPRADRVCGDILSASNGVSVTGSGGALGLLDSAMLVSWAANKITPSLSPNHITALSVISVSFSHDPFFSYLPSVNSSWRRFCPFLDHLIFSS